MVCGSQSDAVSPSNISVSVDVIVKKVLWSQEEADAEVKRRNELNSDKPCRYFCAVHACGAATACVS